MHVLHQRDCQIGEVGKAITMAKQTHTNSKCIQLCLKLRCFV